MKSSSLAFLSRNLPLRVAPLAFCCVALGLTAPAILHAGFTTGMDASVVVGQANFTDQVNVASQTVMRGPAGAAVSATGKLAIADQEDGRVLIWNTIPTVNGTPADVVVGKPNFTDVTGGVTASRMGVHIDSVTFSPDGTKLIVCDALNNRVLIWNTVPTTNGAAADVVIGQTDFVTGTPGLSATKLAHPTGVTVTSDGRLLIVEVDNNRVMIYNSIPTVNGAAADVVIGQTSFVTNGFGSGASQFNQPWGVAVSPVDGRLLIGDIGNNRVLVFNTIPTSNGAAANVVIGQIGFGFSVAAATATGLNQPFAAAVSPSGQLAIGDNGNNRVLIYDSVPVANGAAANAVLGQPDFTTSTSFTGGISARSMSSAYQVAFTADGRLIVPGTGMQRAMIFGRLVAPVNGALGDVVTGGFAPNAAGANDGTVFDDLTRGGILAQNGTIAFPGTLEIGTGGVTDVPPGSNFQAIWKHNGITLTRLARTNDPAPETGGTPALFSMLPLVPAINDLGEASFLASLKLSGASTPPTTPDNDTGLWSELGGTGLQILIREGDQIPGLTAGTLVGNFGTGCYATARISGTEGESAFSILMKGGSTDTALLRCSPVGTTTSTVQVVARENTPAPDIAGQTYGALNSSMTNSVRMDAQGGIAFGALLRPSGGSALFFQPRGGAVVKAFTTGDAAPGTITTFRILDIPSMGDAGTFSFHAYLNATGDNALSDRADGVWRGTTAGGFTNILRHGDTNALRPGLNLPSAAAKVGNIWGGWLNNNNRGAWRGWVDMNGDNVATGYPADKLGIYTDASGTVALIIKSDDAAPGVAGANIVFIDHPVIGGGAANNVVAFVGKMTGAVTAANDEGVWRSVNGAAPTLVLRTGESITTTQGVKTVADIDIPGSNDPEFRQWEQPVMDATGRLLVVVTFTDGATSQILVP